MSDQEYEERESEQAPPDGELLEAQEHKGYGEDEGEREEELDELDAD
jgi:hypothetical protein